MNDLISHTHIISKHDRYLLIKQNPFLLWFTGLSGSGKSTIASAVEAKLHAQSKLTYLLDGDNVRHRLNSDLGFDDADRTENIRRVGELCYLFLDSGIIVLSAFISPFRKGREAIQTLVGKEHFVEIFIDTSIDLCEARETKGFYQKARKRQIENFTGISSTYEVPSHPDIHIKNDIGTVEEASNTIIEYLIINKRLY